LRFFVHSREQLGVEVPFLLFFLVSECIFLQFGKGSHIFAHQIRFSRKVHNKERFKKYIMKPQN
jgi:hypothetical protein